MRAFSTTIAAEALGVDRKTLDNILAREARHLIGAGRRGRGRRVSVDALERIAVALILKRDLGTGIANGLELADRIVRSEAATLAVGPLIALEFDLPRVRTVLEASLAVALEGMAEFTRGRPRSQSKAGRL